MKILTVVTLVAGVFVGGLEGPRTSLAAEAYHLGVAFGLTGTGAPYSREAANAIRMAVDEINNEGGFLGTHRIKLFTENTRTKPDVAESVVTRLIERDEVRAVIGTYSSATALAIKPICRTNGVLHIATISNSEDITRTGPQSVHVFGRPQHLHDIEGSRDRHRQTGCRERLEKVCNYCIGLCLGTLQSGSPSGNAQGIGA